MRPTTRVLVQPGPVWTFSQGRASKVEVDVGEDTPWDSPVVPR